MQNSKELRPPCEIATVELIPSKHELCLTLLVKAGLNGIYKITSIEDYGETCLNTTISELGLKKNFRIDRCKKPHTHSSGGKTFFMWYWLANRFEAQKALRYINQQRKIRAVPALPTSLLLSFPVKKGVK